MSNITTNTNTIKLNTFQTVHVPDQNQNKSVSKTLQSTTDREQEKAAENWVNMQISKNNLDGQSTLFDITKGLIDIPKHLSLKFIFKSLLKCKVNVNAVDSKTEKTPLMTAIEMSDDRHDKFHIILLLLYHGANVNRCPNTFKSPLDLAVDLGNLDIVRILLNKRANSFEKNEFTLLTAIRNNNVDIAQLLVQNGATLTLEYASAHLFKAIDDNALQMVQFLLQNGATLTNKEAYSLIYRASFENNVDMAQCLVQNFPSLTEEYACKILCTAVIDNNVEMAQCLVQKNVTLSPDFVSTLIIRAIKNNNLPMAKLLLQNGATLTVENASAHLFEAIDDNALPMVQFLLQNGANINAIDSYGKTPINHAVELFVDDIALLLIKNGATLTKIDAYTLFCDNNQDKNVDMARCLVESGVTLTTEVAAVLLKCAIKTNNVPMAQLLVQNGVALTAVSESKLNKLTTFAIKKTVFR